MVLFFDSSALLAASGSATGAARYILSHQKAYAWTVLTSGYCVAETLRNLPKLGEGAERVWRHEIEPGIQTVPDAFGIGEKALVFPKAKDRPVVVSALAAQASVLITLDQVDFHGALGSQIYGMKINTPAEFLIGRRQAGEI